MAAAGQPAQYQRAQPPRVTDAVHRGAGARLARQIIHNDGVGPVGGYRERESGVSGAGQVVVAGEFLPGAIEYGERQVERRHEPPRLRGEVQHVSLLPLDREPGFRGLIEDAGGWEHDTLTEDSDLSYRAQLKGWKFVYVPSIECLSELPVDTYGFQVQQSRWAKGLTQVAMKLLPSILKADVPFKVKAEAFFHLTPNISYPMMIIVSALMLPVMVVRFYMGWFQMVVIDLPLIIASFWSISAFYVVAHRELFPKTWKREFLFLPALMAAGVALTIINSRAVLEALFRHQTAFARTPKYAIGGSQKVKIENIQYRRRSGWLPYAELAVGTFFLGMTAFAIESFNFLAVPFLLLFVGGYYWAGASTLWEEYQGKLAWQKQQAIAAAER